jgi:hypothetical protein
MDNFSLIDRSMQSFEQRSDIRALYSLASPWTAKESTPKARKARIDRARVSFAEFDAMYFPPEMYQADYSQPNAFHTAVVDACALRDKHVTVILGPNGHAKSATVYKWDIWAMLFGYRHFIAYAGETLDGPRTIIRAINSYLTDNARIRSDFPDLEFRYAATEYLHVRTHHNPKGTVVIPLSTDRSARGKLVNLTERPDAIHVEDLENRTSSLTTEAVRNRRDRIEEMRNALAPHGSLTITANNFDERTLANELLTEYEAGKLDPKFQVRSFPAWGKYYTRKGEFTLDRGVREGPLWPERFPAKSEPELRLLMGVSSDADWQGGQQQRPIKPQGDFFLASHWAEYEHLPKDCVGITYVDPNLARKGKGDRTCIGALLYSYQAQLLYAYGIRYRSYADSNQLIGDLVALWRSLVAADVRIISAAMDGNVNQESHWYMHLRNYATIHHEFLPFIEFERYNVEIIAKLAQAHWTGNVIRMPSEWQDAEERRQFEGDLLAFTGRKLQGKKDDGPDWLICAVQKITEAGISINGARPLPVVGMHNNRLGRGPRLGKI